MLQFLGDSKSQRASKLHYWFKSYGNISEWVDLPISRSEQTPGNWFHPVLQSTEATNNGSNDKPCKI